MKPPVDIDDITTWPRDVSDIVSNWANQYKGTTEYTSDLALPFEAASTLLELLSGHLLRAYHCTRLLPHEIDAIQADGLQPLSVDLVNRRIETALAANAITNAEAESLHETHVFAKGAERSRENQISLILGKGVFQSAPSGCQPLLSNWGGEGIYWAVESGIKERLKELGTPAIVVALLDMSDRASRHLFFPALPKVFVGAALGLEDAYSDVFYKAPVPALYIESVLQAGEPAYESLASNIA